MVWGIYLDGGEAGITIHGNIIGATLHGAVFDNAGGNNTQTNNIFVAGPDSDILMDFGAPGAGAPRSVAGNTVKRNIFYFHGKPASGARAMLGSQAGWSSGFLKPNGSDHNVFFSPDESAAALPMFPGRKTLAQWAGRASGGDGPITCKAPGEQGSMIVRNECSSFDFNATGERKLKLRESGNRTFVVNVDCDGDWSNCKTGSVNTRICLTQCAPTTGCSDPHHLPPGAVDNQAWLYSAKTKQLTMAVNGKCVEMCSRGGAVGGCDGQAGSIVQLRPCVASEPKQQWLYSATAGTFHNGAAPKLCLAQPVLTAADVFDSHSAVADPLFVKDPVATGDWKLKPNSPAFAMGFEAIPPITAPEARCGEGGGLPSCLSLVLAV